MDWLEAEAEVLRKEGQFVPSKITEWAAHFEKIGQPVKAYALYYEFLMHHDPLYRRYLAWAKDELERLTECLTPEERKTARDLAAALRGAKRGDRQN